MGYLAAVPENFRAEIARHRLSRSAVCDLIGMHENTFSMFVNGVRPLTSWAAHNIGWGINRTTGLAIFDVDMDAGPVPSAKGYRSHRRQGVRLPTKRRRRRTTTAA